MKTLLAGCLLISINAFAADYTPYEKLMMECLDHGRNPITEEQMLVCHKESKELILQASNEARQIYLDCIDYGHSPVSLNKDVVCIKEASKALEK